MAREFWVISKKEDKKDRQFYHTAGGWYSSVHDASLMQSNEADHALSSLDEHGLEKWQIEGDSAMRVVRISP